MILYYTGTGNSKYVAKYLGKEINEEPLNLFDKIKNEDYSDIESSSPFVVVSPTYAWQIPHILRDFLLKTKLVGNDKIYFVMTCGGGIYGAEKHLRTLCKKMGKEFMGVAEIVMPENYIAMFDAPNEEQSASIIEKASPYINSCSKRILDQRELSKASANLKEKFFSSVVNGIFYSAIVKDKKFFVNDLCIGCGKCERVCIKNNIQMVDGKPTWNGNCTHCMACICGCPQKAIEYGEHTAGLNRYICKDFK